MDLRTHLNHMDREEQDAFAKRCGTTIGYLRKALSHGQQIGPAICVRIERESSGAVTRQELRDDWRMIWPELDHPKDIAA
ncbi:YdaS family helix-turn-helix protein (plasmid) [Chromobacterium amazonense]|uniref:transcriptional regulator n=1 Tax=Chromobacterium amazonense TaxID=1382803 RepID=UPI00237DC8D0|nr:YdaS family helix-turn-helix protein [Chromobacterium amazonense]MDE1714912.1 YdaS family helix-turn-helix protein [Chromobacterium amazonense]